MICWSNFYSTLSAWSFTPSHCRSEVWPTKYILRRINHFTHKLSMLLCRPSLHTGFNHLQWIHVASNRTYNTKYSFRNRRLSFPKTDFIDARNNSVHKLSFTVKYVVSSNYHCAVIHLIAMPRRCWRVGALLMKMKDGCSKWRRKRSGRWSGTECLATAPIAAAVWRRINRLYSRVFSLPNEIKSWLLSDRSRNVEGGRAPLICNGTFF